VTQKIALHRNELTITTVNLFCFAFYRETPKVDITYLLMNPAVYPTALLHIVQNGKATSLIYALFNLPSAF